jgi:hypothetical protein
MTGSENSRTNSIQIFARKQPLRLFEQYSLFFTNVLRQHLGEYLEALNVRLSSQMLDHRRELPVLVEQFCYNRAEIFDA